MPLLISMFATASARWRETTRFTCGGPLLSVYAENPRGQFQSWRHDGHAEAFWRMVTGVERPPVRLVHIDKLLRAFE